MEKAEVKARPYFLGMCLRTCCSRRALISDNKLGLLQSEIEKQRKKKEYHSLRSLVSMCEDDESTGVVRKKSNGRIPTKRLQSSWSLMLDEQEAPSKKQSAERVPAINIDDSLDDIIEKDQDLEISNHRLVRDSLSDLDEERKSHALIPNPNAKYKDEQVELDEIREVEILAGLNALNQSVRSRPRPEVENP